VSDLREIKRAARRHLHEAMKVAAIYIPPVSGSPVPIFVRVHSKSQAVEMDGRDDRMAARIVPTPMLLFMRQELSDAGVTLKSRGTVSVEPGEAYKLELAEPVDDITVKWIVTQLSEREAEGLPVPDDG
jgi:hypothetical protein